MTRSNSTLRVADYAADTWASREVVPVLRYVARQLIRDEFAWCRLEAFRHYVCCTASARRAYS